MAKCNFCPNSNSGYSCPRCNAAYCSLACYRRPEHEGCYEQFYKECVADEMRLRSKEDAEDPAVKRRMIETLKRMRQQDAEDPIDPNADDGDEDEEDHLDSDDDDELSDRMAGVDLDDADAIWKGLTPGERKEFERLVDSGDISKMVPEYKPWWEFRCEEKKVREVGNDGDIEDATKRCPAVDTGIAPLSHFIKSTRPSPLLKFGLLNALYPYVYCLRYFSGDIWSEANLRDCVTICMTLSDNLRCGANFETADEALESAATNVNVNAQWSVDAKTTRGCKRDVYKVVRGPRSAPEHRNLYLLSAVSDLRRIFALGLKLAKGATKKEGKGTPLGELPPWKLDDMRREAGSSNFPKPAALDSKEIKKCLMKVEFYLSWANENGHEYDVLR